jgi:hypothetical protein
MRAEDGFLPDISGKIGEWSIPMERKQKQPTAHFKMPPPYSPMTGEHAELLVPGVKPYCAMMQVAAEDTHDNYVVCRGYDPRFWKFFDYDENDLATKPGIPVGKPFGSRGPDVYEVGQIFPALIPLTRIGETPGVGETSEGHPEDLDETVEILYDDDDHPISWMLLDAAASNRQVRFKLKEELVFGLTATAWERPWDAEVPGYDDPEETEITVQDYAELGFTGPEGCNGVAQRRVIGENDANDIYEILHMQRVAFMLTAVADGAVLATDETFSIKTVAVAYPAGGLLPGDGVEPTTCKNVMRLPAEDGARVVLFYNETSDLWEGFPAAHTTECP